MTNTLIIKNVSLTTSKKDKFKLENKKVYININDEDVKGVEDFGLPVFESKTGENFFIVKTSKFLALYGEDDEYTSLEDLTGLDTPNFAMENVNVAIEKNFSKEYNKTFYRLKAIEGDTQPKIMTHESPFK